MDNSIDWVEIPVKDMARAKDFYKKVLGKELADMAMHEGVEYSFFPWNKDAMGSGAALIKSKDYKPDNRGVVVYFSCDDLSVELARVVPNGGKVVLPKTAIGESGFMAHIIDTEGNRVGLHSWK